MIPRPGPDAPLEELLRWGVEYVKSLSPEEYRAMVEQQRQSYVRSEMLWDEDATVIVG